MAALLINNCRIVVVAILPLTTHPTSWAELHVGTPTTHSSSVSLGAELHVGTPTTHSSSVSLGARSQ